MSALFSSPGRRIYAVDGGAARPLRPRFDPALDLVTNVGVLADWEWGARRADWAIAAAHELLATGGVDPLDPLDVREWVAAVLCAAAVDSGRDRRPHGWGRTLTSIAELTGVGRESILARHAVLQSLTADAQAG